MSVVGFPDTPHCHFLAVGVLAVDVGFGGGCRHFGGGCQNKHIWAVDCPVEGEETLEFFTFLKGFSNLLFSDVQYPSCLLTCYFPGGGFP